ncbi:MAG: Stp1/IreP family PP2C-type Ser/Thr phosphatase [Lachnospiraceae bacterium]|nr:Stp1/IreP family PP2C-type Ser/Thr phosphatase [Lachnospiraceae bacterium]
MKSYYMTDIGSMRKMNQDYVYCSDEEVGILPNLYIVADGMGGHKGGDYASRESVISIVEFVKENTECVTPISLLESAIRAANKKLVEDSESNEELMGMGTTVVVATVLGNSLYVANVGDSRLYLIDNEEIRQITEDHSLVEEMIKRGEIERREARFHPNKNIITRALGTANDLEIDFFEIEMEQDNIILMCTDGLTNMMDDDEIRDTVTGDKNNYNSAVERLIKKANSYGGKDNITVILATN